MVHREDVLNKKELHPLYDQFRTKYNQVFYVNCNTGQMAPNRKIAVRGRGGILADEMGLGKTFMTLSLI